MQKPALLFRMWRFINIVMMKRFALLFYICFCTSIIVAQTKKPDQPAPLKDGVQIVEASCGQCKFGMKGKSCDLAVRINGKAYFVDGTKIDDHGDAHASDGFCEKIRKAEVKGTVINNRFVATYFKVLPKQKARN